MAKPPALEIKLDGYEMVVNDQVYHPHEGESIWLPPMGGVDVVVELAQLAQFKTKVEAIQGDPGAELAAADILDEMIDDFCKFLAKRGIRWNATDMNSKPLPQPDGDPARVKLLGRDVISWLLGFLLVTEAPSAPKKRLEALADHVLGYRISAEPDVQRWGPQPRAGILSVLLQEFPSYTLAELKRENWQDLVEILDYRRAKLAVELFNAGKDGAEQLAKRPDLMELLLEMGRAQAGTDTVTLDQLLESMAEQRDQREEEDQDVGS